MRMWVVAVVLGWFGVAAAGPRTDALVIVIDRAMPADKLAAVNHLLSEEIAKLKPGTEVSIVSVAATAKVELGLRGIDERDRILRALGELRPAARSDLRAGLRKARDLLASTKRIGRYVLVITESTSFDTVLPLAAKMHHTGITISAVGYQSENAAALARLAQVGHGTSSVANDRAMLARGLRAAVVLPPERVAVVFAIDRSVGTCGQRLEAAKALAQAGIAVLDSNDLIGIVSYDTDAQMLVSPQPAAQRQRVTTELSRLTCGGHRGYNAGLEVAFAGISKLNAPVKHVVLIDGGTRRFDGFDLVEEMRQARITVSVIELPWADDELLSMIATLGAGRFYAGNKVPDFGSLFGR